MPDQDQELWAHPIVKPEAGCLLIAHPNAFTNSQQYFHRVVIFIFAHEYVFLNPNILTTLSATFVLHITVRS